MNINNLLLFSGELSSSTEQLNQIVSEVAEGRAKKHHRAKSDGGNDNSM